MKNAVEDLDKLMGESGPFVVVVGLGEHELSASDFAKIFGSCNGPIIFARDLNKSVDVDTLGLPDARISDLVLLIKQQKDFLEEIALKFIPEDSLSYLIPQKKDFLRVNNRKFKRLERVIGHKT